MMQLADIRVGKTVRVDRIGTYESDGKERVTDPEQLEDMNIGETLQVQEIHKDWYLPILLTNSRYYRPSELELVEE